MPIQPYFPEPLTVSENVSEAKHRPRVAFIRKVVGWHFSTSAAVVAMALGFPMKMAPEWAFIGFLACLIGLTLVRRAFDGGKTENILSTSALLPTLFFLSQWFEWLHRTGVPVVALVPVVFGTGLYALLCGNDFSYIGMFVLTGAFELVAVVTARVFGYFTPTSAWLGLVLGSAFLFYFSYDLSMLVKRRRFGEGAAAVADLYRDLLNFTTYTVRVYLHWRRFRFI
ncbi:MAG: hypothetical protein JSS66_12495 [Armatimonadetes bacterium]|nr:hypothetical protein [Armatimonadota bacterium]